MYCCDGSISIIAQPYLKYIYTLYVVTQYIFGDIIICSHITSLQVRLAIAASNEQDGCHNFSTNYSQYAVLVSNANCSVNDKLRTAQFADVELLIISGTLVRYFI